MSDYYRCVAPHFTLNLKDDRLESYRLLVPMGLNEQFARTCGRLQIRPITTGCFGRVVPELAIGTLGSYLGAESRFRVPLGCVSKLLVTQPASL